VNSFYPALWALENQDGFPFNAAFMTGFPAKESSNQSGFANLSQPSNSRFPGTSPFSFPRVWRGSRCAKEPAAFAGNPWLPWFSPKRGGSGSPRIPWAGNLFSLRGPRVFHGSKVLCQNSQVFSFRCFHFSQKTSNESSVLTTQFSVSNRWFRLVAGCSVVMVYFQHSSIFKHNEAGTKCCRPAEPKVETGTGKSTLTLSLKIARGGIPYHMD